MTSQNYYNGGPPQMQPSNPYAQAAFSQDKPSEPNYDYGDKSARFSDVKPKFNDLVFGLLFILQFAAFIAIAAISLRSFSASTAGGNGFGQTGGTSITLNASTAYLLAIISGAGFVFSIILLLLVRTFTTAVLEITLVLSVLLSIAYAVYMFIEKSYAAAVIASLFAIFAVIAYFPMRRRIPFSKALLLFTLRIAKEYPSVYVIAILGALIQTAYSVFWSFASVAIYQHWTPGAAGNNGVGNPSQGAVIGLMVFAVFSFYWTSQVILNLTLTTIAGIYGSFYFSGGGKGAPRRVAGGAFRRAATYSFGSICFGSLIVAILDVIRAGLSLLQSYESGQGDMVGSAIACCAGCCVGCIASIAEYFNRYAFIEIALYGKPYVKAAKDTWRLFKDRGITALVNDSLINNIWTFGSFAVGLLCSVFAYIYLSVSNPSYIANNPGIKSAVIGYAFIIGFFICHTLGYGALSSGASTIFVGLAEDPQALADRDPALFELIRQTYPQVVTSV